MSTPRTLHRSIVVAFALVFAGALLAAILGVLLLIPRFTSPLETGLYVAVLLVLDVAVFVGFAGYVLRRRLLVPLERMIAGAEAVADGDYRRRLPRGETVELARLADAVNGMAERLITHREQLAANVRSLEETNRQLTEARDELIRAEKLSSAGRLAAGIAHEIGNPLGALLGYLGVFRRGASAEEQELISAAEAEVKRIDRIVRGLLDYARPREAKPQATNVNDVVRQTMELLETQGRLRGIETRVELPTGLPRITADPYQLQQVLVNLLLNAVDALQDAEAPAVTIRTDQVRFRPRLQVPPRRKDDPPDVDYSHRRRFHQTPRVPREDPFPVGEEVVRIVVADNGPGIAAEILDQIFEPFVTTKEPGKGTGLGLAVAARLIDAMGGTIRAETGVDGGAVFTILFPQAASVSSRSEGEEPEDAPAVSAESNPNLRES